jgi:L-alanine-DL-glutamate epimerase-like enolase superfamily enzyme
MLSLRKTDVLPPLALTVDVERWPIRGAFAISRGAKSEAIVIVAEVTDGRHSGRGECTPYARYGETPESVLAAIRAAGELLAKGASRAELQAALPPGAARNALDCALWDYEAKRAGESVSALCGCAPASVLTAFTISLGEPGRMAEAASAAVKAGCPLLKLKLGGGSADAARIAAVRAAVPSARLIVDANEAWTPDCYEPLALACAEAGVEVIEQPFPAGKDETLAHLPRPVPVCADESVFTAADLPRLAGLYDAVNVKLDKAGGLTGALELARAAREIGLKLMVGCMVATSLAMAPAMLLVSQAAWVDLDGPLLLEKDREPGLAFRGAWVSPPEPALWG